MSKVIIGSPQVNRFPSSWGRSQHTGFLARYHLYSIPPLAITAILIFTIGDNIPNVAINVIVILFLLFLAFNRILAAFDKSIARERSRAFWRISRLMPLEKKKKGRAK